MIGGISCHAMKLMHCPWDRLLAALKSGSWLIRRRVVAYSGILLGCEVLAFLFLVAGTHGWVVPLSHPVTTDYVSFYAAGHLADAGTPAAAYLRAAHFAAEQQATARGIEYNFFFYPPVFLLLCAILARLPYLVSFVAFETGTLLLCLMVIRRILTHGGGLNQKGEAINGVLLLPLLAYPAIFINFGVGQNGFLTAALFGGATLLIDRRPWLAGILFGALCYKPHFGLLIPIALIAGGRWRGFTAATATVAALVALSLALFGWQSWHDFFIAIAASHTTYESTKVDVAAYVTIFGALRVLGASPPVAYLVQAVFSLAAATLVAWGWRRNLSLPVRAAMLAIGTLVAVPLALFYDLMLAAIAMAWLVQAGWRRGFLPWEKTLLVANFIAPLLVRGFGRSFHIPIGPFITLSLLTLCIARAHSEIRPPETGGSLAQAIPPKAMSNHNMSVTAHVNPITSL